MPKQKIKNEELLFAVIATLIFFTVLMNHDKVKIIIDAFIIIFLVLFVLCLIGYLLYFLDPNKKINEVQLFKNDLPTIKTIRSPITNKAFEKTIKQESINFYRIHEVTECHLLNQPDRKIPTKWSRDLISALEWKKFEDLCAEYFRLKKYKAKLTNNGADGGIDIYLFKDTYSFTKHFAIIQCKAWNSRRVGVKPIRELYGVMTAEQSRFGIFITSGSYTKEAVDFSMGKKIKLISGDFFLRLINSLPKEQQQILLKKIIPGDYTTPSCPSCGIKMVERTAQKGNNVGQKFWGCRNFPKCRHTFNKKHA